MRPLFGLLYQPKMIEEDDVDDDDDCGVISGLQIGRGNRSTRRKAATVPLCPPQFPHDLTRARSRRLTACVSRSITVLTVFPVLMNSFNLGI
jgi:hypothetical protein